MTPALPQSFLTHPLAHRALHDRAAGRPENSPSAIQAALDAGYGIEIDVQRSKDGQAMVFHDYQLDRLTGEKGAIAQRNAADLQATALSGGQTGDTIPTLQQVLDQVAGRVPLLVEIKDQDGALGPNTGALEAECARLLATYDGPVAVMSFNPHAIAAFAGHAPDIPRGLVTGRFRKDGWLLVPEQRLAELRDIPDFDRVGASFISHRADDLANPRVAALKAGGAAILCWTTRSAEEGRKALTIADNVTFEGYLPEPGAPA